MIKSVDLIHTDNNRAVGMLTNSKFKIELEDGTAQEILVQFIRERKSWSYTLACFIYCQEHKKPVAKFMTKYLYLYNNIDYTNYINALENGDITSFITRNCKRYNFAKYAQCLIREMRQEYARLSALRKY